MASTKLHFICEKCGFSSPYRSNWTFHMKDRHKMTDVQIKLIKEAGITQEMMTPKKKCMYNYYVLLHSKRCPKLIYFVIFSFDF